MAPARRITRADLSSVQPALGLRLTQKCQCFMDRRPVEPEDQAAQADTRDPAFVGPAEDGVWLQAQPACHLFCRDEVLVHGLDSYP